MRPIQAQSVFTASIQSTTAAAGEGRLTNTLPLFSSAQLPVQPRPPFDRVLELEADPRQRTNQTDALEPPDDAFVRRAEHQSEKRFPFAHAVLPRIRRRTVSGSGPVPGDTP